MMTERHDSMRTELHHVAGIFTTRLVQHLHNGRRLVFFSRRVRKALPPVQLASDGSAIAATPAASPWLQLWAPHRLAWWIAVLFIGGSACFAVASFASNWPQQVPAWLGGSRAINTVFFVGSLFFTSAAWLQLLEAINGDVADIGVSAAKDQRAWRWFSWKPRNAGYSASLVQFVGTLLFNFNTGDAMIAGLAWSAEDLLVWAPDVIGSICFLVASYLALVEVSHRFWSWQPRQLSWWIVMLNLLGSMALMVAAVVGFVVPSSGNAEWLWGANLFTLIGAVCFLLASYLLIPELFGADSQPGAVASS
ncbi:hypothetical protein [Candidatus Accumulibacter sp. ACC003]|uniref:hypothetical protein n=1 Tax=Candidatus Accumulibacter sp. ACC003 TaxID=2823334 RepID=UPI0025C2ADEB|nr:hypothetical protein [Candidatus Accumulibacter sp. ACC003]